jgi:DNA-directed RNA polymerase beta subunit
MRLDQLKPFRRVNKILIPRKGIDKKHVAIAVFPENNSFLDVYRYLAIDPAYVRYVFVPTTKLPRTKLTPAYKRALMEHGLRPVMGYFGQYDKLIGFNFFVDYGNFIKSAESKWKFTRYNSGRSFIFMNALMDVVSGLPSTHHKILLYTVNLNGPISDKILFRRIFPLYKMLAETGRLPVDKVLLYFYDQNGGTYMLLWDKNVTIPISKIKAFLLTLKTDDIDEIKKLEKENIVQDIDRELGEHPKKQVIKDAVKTFLNRDKNIDTSNPESIKSLDLISKAVAYHVVGDVDKVYKAVKNDEVYKKRIIEKYSDNLIARPPAKQTARNPFNRMINIPDMVDNETPSHLIEKRRLDFSTSLDSDIKSIFKPLDNKSVPLKLAKLEKRTVRDPVSELKPSIKDRYDIELKDPEGNVHKTYIELPHLTENGTFLINGEQRILVNQLITHPIFFFKPFYGQFSSGYSVMVIQSKQIKRGAYLLSNLAGQKTPLIALIAYKMGFKNAMDLFGITYAINDQPDAAGTNVKLPDGRYVSFKFEEGNESAKQLVNGLNYVSGLPQDKSIESPEFWRDAFVNHTGTRNSIYVVDEVWNNIVTPIEKEVLAAKGDPITLPGIIKYISSKIVDGFIDDRNSLDKQRIRTSELFSTLISKQINSAYNEYLNKRLSGDENAKYELQAKKAYSEVNSSQNVQLLENINPLEEISMMTRVTPIGIGGIPNNRAISQKGRNIHYSYFGNIDPLETPTGEQVGIVQHLTVGSDIINKRGMFGLRTAANINSSSILSSGPASIPFVESDDGARVTMSAGQMKQAIPLLEPEAPAIQTGYESLLVNLLSNNFIKRSPVDGVVTKIEGSIIRVRSSANDKEFTVDIKPRLLKSGQGKHGISTFKPIVSVGQRVQKDQIVAEGGGIKDGVISTGVNMLVAIMPWKGYNFEDGVVISESAAKKFTSVHVEEERLVLEEGQDIVHIANVGDEVEKGGILLTYTSAFEDVESYRHVRSSGGTVSNIEVYVNTPTIPEKLKPIYEAFKKEFTTINGKYPEGAFKEKQIKFEGILIRFITRQEAKLVKGDKLNNRHYNKGVVAIIEKDENMPITPWGERIEMVANPLAIINRMISGQLLEMHTGLISWKLAKLMNEYDRERFIDIFQKVLMLLDGTKNKSYSRSTIQKLKSLSDAAYSNVAKEAAKTKFIPLIFAPFKTPPRDDVIKALHLLGLNARERLKLPEFGITTEPVAIGYLYQQKLEHMAEKKMATRSWGYGYATKTMAPQAGRKRGGGQKLGEGDLYSLLAWDCPVIIEEFFGALSSDHQTKNSIISEIAQTGKGTFQLPRSNPVKEMFSQFLLAIHLTSI